MDRYNSAQVGSDYFDFIDRFSTVVAGDAQGRVARRSGNSREQARNEVKRRLTLENKLHCLSGVLSLSLICLILMSLASTGPRSNGADKSEHKPAIKDADRDENVRAALEEKIRRELLTLGRVFENVSFHVDEDDVVTLSGQVRLPSLKVSAQRAARNIEGVRGVINQLEVQSASFSSRRATSSRRPAARSRRWSSSS